MAYFDKASTKRTLPNIVPRSAIRSLDVGVTQRFGSEEAVPKYLTQALAVAGGWVYWIASGAPDLTGIGAGVPVVSGTVSTLKTWVE